MNTFALLVSAVLAQTDSAPQRLPTVSEAKRPSLVQAAPVIPVRFDQDKPPQPRSEGTLSLDELERMAEVNHPTLSQSLARLDAARGRWLQAGLGPNPRLSYEGMQIGNFGHAGMQGGAVMQEFVLGGKLRLAREAASYGVAQAEQQYFAQRARVLNDLRIEFYNVLAAQRTLDVTRDLVAVGERGVKVSEQLYKVKQAGFVDFLQAQVEFDKAQLALQTAQNRHSAAWRRLATAAGNPALPATALRGELIDKRSEIFWDGAWQRIRTESAELAAAANGVERARWELARAQREPLPNLTVSSGVQYDTDSRYTMANVSAGIPLPIFNRNQGNIATAAADLAASQSDVQRIELNLRNRLAAAFERYANARARVEKYGKSIVPNANQALDVATKGYQQGNFTYLQLLIAQRSYFDAQLQYIDALRELQEAAIAIEGQLLTGALGESPGSGGPAMSTAPSSVGSSFGQMN